VNIARANFNAIMRQMTEMSQQARKKIKTAELGN